MSLGGSKGGLPPDSCCEDEDACLADMKRLIEEFHDNSKCASSLGSQTIEATSPAAYIHSIAFTRCAVL